MKTRLDFSGWTLIVATLLSVVGCMKQGTVISSSVNAQLRIQACNANRSYVELSDCQAAGLGSCGLVVVQSNGISAQCWMPASVAASATTGSSSTGGGTVLPTSCQEGQGCTMLNGASEMAGTWTGGCCQSGGGGVFVGRTTTGGARTCLAGTLQSCN